MLVYNIPAKYQRMIESTLALAVAEIGYDRKYRELGQTGGEEDAFGGPIPDAMIDADREGRVMIVVGIPDGGDPDALASHLHAFAPSSFPAR